MVTNTLTYASLSKVYSTLWKLLCLLLLFLEATIGAAQAPGDYKLVQEKGLWVEQFNSSDTSENRYTANNHIYQTDLRFTYRYVYFSKDGRKYLQKVVQNAHQDREKAWKLVPLEEKDSLTNDRLQLVIESDLQGVDAQTPGYNHTPIRYEYYAPAGMLYFLERSSLVENEKNVWMQPPRARLFRILALAPPPFIQAPFVVGQAWEWQQEVKGFWGDARWKEWKGLITNYYQYTISDEEIISSSLGEISCFVVEGTAKSSLGTTYLTAHYHPDLGFVKLFYTNIDGSKLLLELIKKEQK